MAGGAVTCGNVPAGLVVVVASNPLFCVVCGSDQRIEIRAADDPDARPAVIDCPHCGDLRFPAVYSTGARTA